MGTYCRQFINLRDRIFWLELSFYGADLGGCIVVVVVVVDLLPDVFF